MESSSSMNRIQRTLRHISPENVSNSKGKEIASNGCSAMKTEQVENLLDSGIRGHHQGLENLKWNGWGYVDTELKFNSLGQVSLTGSRYDLSGASFPKLRPWLKRNLDLI